MSTLVADDGTVVNIDDQTGDVTSATDNSGATIPVTPPDSGITQTFAQLISNGVNALIGNKLPPAPVPKPGTVATATPAQAATSTAAATLAANPILKWVAILAGAYFLLKKFA